MSLIKLNALAVLTIVSLASSPAVAQLNYYSNPYQNLVFTPISTTLTGPKYVDLAISAVTNITVSGGVTTVTVVAAGATRTIKFEPNVTSSWYTQISADSTSIMERILRDGSLAPAMSDGNNRYDITLRSLWNWSSSTYYANRSTSIEFRRRSVSVFSGIDSTVSGVFGDTVSSYAWGHLVLRRNGTGADLTYPCLKNSSALNNLISGTCRNLGAMPIETNASCIGLLHLLSFTLRGGVEIENYCSNTALVDASGAALRIVHCGSWWWN